ncbi:MAG: inositol monophosphatase family protein [Pseudomonadota bacterium]
MAELSPLDAEIRDLFRFAAERSIMPRYRALTADQIEMKGEDDPVTIVDREVEAFLTDALTKLAPDVAVVGEEAVAADASIMEKLSGPCWIIDPIDGTSNFASGEGHFGVMIALADAGEAVAGWIYDPQRDRLCHTKRGEGAFVDGEKVTAKSSGDTPANLAAMKGFMPDDARALFEAEIEPHYTIVQPPRAACEQYPLIVLGGHDLAIYERTLPWDHAAGCLFLNEAGGACLRPDGSAYRVDDGRKGMVGGGSRALFDELAERLIKAGYMPAD